MDVTIRKIATKDIDTIQGISASIAEETVDVDFQKLIEQHAAGGDGTNSNSLVAEIDGKVVGYIIATTLYAGFGIQKSGWIMSIGVLPEHMGQGLGLNLARRACDIFKEQGVKSIYSSVLWDSIDVLSFFKKLGFQRSDFINLKKDL